MLPDVERDLTGILQALLLAAREPLSLERLAALFDEAERPDRTRLRQALQILQQQAEGSSQELVEVAGGYRYQIRSCYAGWVSRLSEEKPPRYSRALLETLSLIAYRQPITRGEIEEVRGVSVSSQIIRTLEDREWVRVVGHREVPGRPALYATTRQFLDYFNLKSLNELPPLDELRQLADAEPEEWQDELDRAPHSPLLQVDQELDEGEAAEDPADLADLLEAPLPEVKELTFADLAERFVQHQDDEEPSGQ
ncbi:SMC-Scp complex subunit ScpB [Marinospirillum alkaliphilum]|uniref:Segregation and condensation protein B n=1 Tax=Marinospirillum alkaliphilum DSM 21637 TaxID=1122209 RepID=A0A1K1W0P4_9GAMM|nr:SMC-Scp complex subunit ScpB [Marinospirillum alkaliphilum]SFX30405.1 segregation and condensation protein B [Marinospirillum alkaliphilum DSM 21637]